MTTRRSTRRDSFRNGENTSQLRRASSMTLTVAVVCLRHRGRYAQRSSIAAQTLDSSFIGPRA